jgi:hypothetical protein
MALELVPLQRSPPIVFPQRPFARVWLYPAFPQVVQHVTGKGRFMVSICPSCGTAESMKFRPVILTCCAYVRFKNSLLFQGLNGAELSV